MRTAILSLGFTAFVSGCHQHAPSKFQAAVSGPPETVAPAVSSAPVISSEIQRGWTTGFQCPSTLSDYDFDECESKIIDSEKKDASEYPFDVGLRLHLWKTADHISKQGSDSAAIFKLKAGLEFIIIGSRMDDLKLKKDFVLSSIPRDANLSDLWAAYARDQPATGGH